MNKKILLPLFSIALISGIALINSCTKENIAPAPPKNYSFQQDFDSMADALRQGWVAVNNSRPLGTSTWQSGSFDYLFGLTSGYAGQNTSHSGVDYAFVAYSAQEDPATGQAPGQASCWLISPAVPFKTGDKIIFWTRTESNPADYPDRMEFRLNLNDNSTNVGNDSSSIGSFTTVGYSINEALTTTGYPGVWTKYEYTISGIDAPKMGRFAFRYWTKDAGPNGSNGTGIGIDAVSYVSK